MLDAKEHKAKIPNFNLMNEKKEQYIHETKTQARKMKDKRKEKNSQNSLNTEMGEMLDVCNSDFNLNLKNFKNILNNIQIFIPKLKFKFWRNLDIFINYNNFLAFKYLLLKYFKKIIKF